MGKFKILAGLTAAALAGVFSVGNASAAPLACPASFTADGTAKVYYNPGQLTAAGGCYIDTDADQDNGTGNDHNDYFYFGYNDWIDTAFDGVDPPNDLSGSWSIPGGELDFAGYDYMLIFKDGKSVTNLVGFLLNEEVSSGLWFSPFTNPPFVGVGQTKEVSHWSMYRREGDDVICVDCGQNVPEPGSFSLLLIGLLGLGGLAFAGARRARV